MKTPQNLYRDVMTGLLLVTGILSFVTGQFLMSTLLFSAAILSSHLDFVRPARAKA
jgi:hypothetical protein